jgi:hypothetical protein
MIVLATSLVLAVAGVTTPAGAFAAPAYEMAVAAPAAGGSPGIYRHRAGQFEASWCRRWMPGCFRDAITICS